MSEPVIRPATVADVDDIASLVADRLDDEDATEARLVLEDPTFDRARWLVATDAGSVVATMAVFAAPCRIGGVEVAANQVEFVATARSHGGRRLQRRLFAAAHRDMLLRGELVTFIVGIPYFYRRLGYEYAVPVPAHTRLAADVAPVSDVTVRTAGPDDLDHLTRLTRAVQATADVAVRPGPELQRWVAVSPVYETLLAHREASPVAAARLYGVGVGAWALDVTAVDAAALRGVLAAATDRAGGELRVLHRPGIAAELATMGEVTVPGDAFYARIGDVAALFDAIRPTLAARLRESALGDAAGRLLLSLYGSSLAVEYDGGEVGEITVGPGEQAPVSAGGSGVPPDLIATLVLGPLGALEMERRHPDVLLGRQRELMAVLFPPQTVDVMSWVVP